MIFCNPKQQPKHILERTFPSRCHSSKSMTEDPTSHVLCNTEHRVAIPVQWSQSAASRRSFPSLRRVCSATCRLQRGDTADRHEFGMADRFEESTGTCAPLQAHNWLMESSKSTVMRERAKNSANKLGSKEEAHIFLHQQPLVAQSTTVLFTRTLAIWQKATR